MSITHASIVPLIGGMTLGAEKIFGSRPEYLLSYTPFINNDSHIVAYYDNEVPYYLLDRGEKPNKGVDVINTVWPCAGLSQLSHGFGDHNHNNRWMVETTNYVLNELKPTVFYGENAPGFAGKIGETVRNTIREIGQSAGYNMTVYRTKSLFHGVSQIRERSFYFFWKGNKTPILNYYRRDRDPIEKVIREAKGNSQREVINSKTPSKDDPYYRYILEEMHGGLTHSEFTKIIEPANARGNDVLSYIELMGHTYDKVAIWMSANGYEREVDKCNYRLNKIAEGRNLMRRGTVIPRDYIGAFVGHYPTMLTHPDEDRYINYREAMTIMGMPDNFRLLNASRKNVNHICQNVPVQTAADMATEVLAFINNQRNLVDKSLVFQYNHSKTDSIIGDISNNLENFMGK